MANKTMVTAGVLQSSDLIKVPVECCEIVSIEKVPGQMHSRRTKLYKFTVVPLTGPWANCEGTFVIDSAEELELVHRKSSWTRRMEAFANFMRRLFTRKYVVEPVLLSAPPGSGPMT